MIRHSIVFFLLSLLMIGQTYAKSIIKIEHKSGDMTPVIRKAIENCKDKEIRIELEKGHYFFDSKYAAEKYCYITNHENGLKDIIFLFENFTSVEVVGNGSSLEFHGQVMPFQFDGCDRVELKNLTIDWDIPFLFQGEVVAVNKEKGWRDLKPATEGFSWKLKNGRIEFPLVDGFKFNSLGSSLAFEKDPKRVAHGAYDMSSRPTQVKKLANGNLRFYEKLKHYPTVGTILNSKGPKGENRYAPAVHVINSDNSTIKNVIVHHALGMGFLFEKAENAIISKCGVYVKEGSERVVSSIADATHFCNCKGDIVVEDCRFEQMLDDGTNVHGTYVVVDEVVNEYTIRYKIGHFQQTGFDFAEINDDMWFIHQPDPSRKEIRKVKSYKTINDMYAEIVFDSKIPAEIKKGDILENKTWNPTFVMKGCTIQNHRARNIIIKTPKKIVIEDNYLSSMMSAILFRGETFYWYESGAVEDVLIQNNTFHHCAYSGSEHAILYVTPRLAKSFDKTICYDRNIRFINNKINSFDSRIVIADRVDGLTIKGNDITQSDVAEQLYPNRPMFDLINCKDVVIENNTYNGRAKTAIKADTKSSETLKVKKNKGFPKAKSIAKK